MKTWIHVLLACSLGIIVYDSLASYISRGTGIDYQWFGLGSLVIYYLSGLFIARLKNIGFGVLAASTVGLVEATVGWAISYLIGPGKPQEAISLPIILFVILFVVILAGFIGLIGALAGIYVFRSK